MIHREPSLLYVPVEPDALLLLLVAPVDPGASRGHAAGLSVDAHAGLLRLLGHPGGGLLFLFWSKLIHGALWYQIDPGGGLDLSATAD